MIGVVDDRGWRVRRAAIAAGAAASLVLALFLLITQPPLQPTLLLPLPLSSSQESVAAALGIGNPLCLGPMLPLVGPVLSHVYRFVAEQWAALVGSGIDAKASQSYILFAEAMTRQQKKQYAEKVREMYRHAHGSYMKHGFPHDEVMPLSCKPRIRGVTPSRGDVDDILGLYSLTYVDSLDTMPFMGPLEDFYEAVKWTVEHVSFDTDIVVSTFETNIRMMGGLLGAHSMMVALKDNQPEPQHEFLQHYTDELVQLALDLGERLLKAFDTNTGLPYSRINLRNGVDRLVKKNTAICTACAGTLLMEFAALSRFSGDPRFENAARRALETIWLKKSATTNLVGSVLNIHTGEWIRAEGGVGAGIDSYYEYLIKSFILLGDKTYMQMFDTHYDAILKYLKMGPHLVNVNIHKPTTFRPNMDALQAFFPGMQVLVGDLSQAIDTHRMHLGLLMEHKFMPEAFDRKHKIVWGNHPLRPEFAESTYMLYKATGDPVFLEIGKYIVDNYEMYARVKCGYASFKDIRTLLHEDSMESFVIAETFKYLYLLFAEREDLPVDVDSFVFTTEAHPLPLSLATVNITLAPFTGEYGAAVHETMLGDFCANTQRRYEKINYLRLFNVHTGEYTDSCKASHIRHGSNGIPTQHDANWKRGRRSEYGEHGEARHHVDSGASHVTPTRRSFDPIPEAVAPRDLDVSNEAHLEYLEYLGITVEGGDAGEVHLVFVPTEDIPSSVKREAALFMGEMAKVARQMREKQDLSQRSNFLISASRGGEGSGGAKAVVHSRTYEAAPGLFGPLVRGSAKDAGSDGVSVTGAARLASPFDACSSLINAEDIAGAIAVVKRGSCMFAEKVQHCQRAGALGVVVLNDQATEDRDQPLLVMSGMPEITDVTIPAGFLGYLDGRELEELVRAHDTSIQMGI